jgi:hypothetical protein
MKENRTWKKFLVITALLIGIFWTLPGLSWGVTWYTKNPLVFVWNAVSPLNSGDTIQYQVYLQPYPAGTQTLYGSPVQSTQITITLTTIGQFYIGIQSQELSGGVVIYSSVISWSNDPTVTQGGIVFGAYPRSRGNMWIDSKMIGGNKNGSEQGFEIWTGGFNRYPYDKHSQLRDYFSCRASGIYPDPTVHHFAACPDC